LRKICATDAHDLSTYGALVDKVLFNFPGYLGSIAVINWIRVAQSLIYCVMPCGPLLVVFAIFLANALYGLLRSTASFYDFGIFKLVII